MTALTVTGVVGTAGPTALRVVGGTVAAAGPEVEPEPGDRVLDGTGLGLVPGLVNGHTHAAMTLFRGFGDDLPLMEWLQTRIWPAEARLTADDVYWGTRLACLEMARSGTTSFWDMYWHGDAITRAVADGGLRARVGAVVFDGLDPAALDRGQVVGTLDAIEGVAAAAGAAGRVGPTLAPHGIYTVSRESLTWVAEVAAERAIPVQIHLSETEHEVEECLARHGVRPAVLLDQVGLLGPSTVLAHGCWLDRAELELVAQRGATVVTNPVSNLKLVVGRVFPWPEAAAAGVRVGLGTDGAASNNNLDLLEEVKFFALLQKHAAGDPRVAPAGEALAVATGRRSPLLGGQALLPGAPADFSLVRLQPELAPGDLEANLVYAATGSVVDTVVVGGEVVVDGREVPGGDEVVARAAEAARRVTAG